MAIHHVLIPRACSWRGRGCVEGGMTEQPHADFPALFLLHFCISSCYLWEQIQRAHLESFVIFFFILYTRPKWVNFCFLFPFLFVCLYVCMYVLCIFCMCACIRGGQRCMSLLFYCIHQGKVS